MKLNQSTLALVTTVPPAKQQTKQKRLSKDLNFWLSCFVWKARFLQRIASLVTRSQTAENHLRGGGGIIRFIFGKLIVAFHLLQDFCNLL